jgi:hypothetical protein
MRRLRRSTELDPVWLAAIPTITGLSAVEPSLYQPNTEIEN